MKDYIDIGDWVNVSFEYVNGESECEVLGLPQDTGDSWRLKRQDGTIVYVQAFSKMVKINRGN